jgi:hypothetical protein
VDNISGSDLYQKVELLLMKEINGHSFEILSHIDRYNYFKNQQIKSAKETS